MASALLRESSGTFQRTFAAQLGCDPSAFAMQGLTVVERPVESWEPQLAIVAECGIGSVVSTKDERLNQWASEQQLEAHFRVFLSSFLEGMAARARELGYAAANSHSPAVGMALAEDVPLPGRRDGLKLEELSPSRIDELRKAGDFENALGEEGEYDKLARFKRAMALVTSQGDVAAASGVWEQYPGIDEIGVDVLSPFRGNALASFLTIEATRWVRSLGRWPIYTFGFTNLRSQNNGLRCGYRPVWVLSVVYIPDKKDRTG